MNSSHDASAPNKDRDNSPPINPAQFVNVIQHLLIGWVKVDEEETSNFRDRLLPLIIGLLRTAKLPNVLRLYRDTLTADMKSAIKTAVAELLPVLVARSQESDYTPAERMVDTDGGGSLASKLRSLSSESFVQLLGAIFKIVRQTRFKRVLKLCGGYDYEFLREFLVTIKLMGGYG
ncbi:unnamed protein product [Ilex paraguariensis]|uniref:Small subunit processome component 20 homolog n=1 Tax=Ilex paraguariensis TaxID=185542 RepID=A0ABC8TDC3_9AQUA